MDFLQDAFKGSEGDSGDMCTSAVTRSDTIIILDITYDDPELRVLFPVTSSNWASENLGDSLKQGRVTNDLWALGLPTPDTVTDVCVIDDQFLCVRVVVTCNDLVDLSSVSDPANKQLRHLKIKKISIVNKKTAAKVPEQQSTREASHTLTSASDNDTMGISPIMTVSDYYRRFHLGAIPAQPTVPPLFTTSTQPPHEASQVHSEPITEPNGAAGTPCRDKLVELENKLFSTELELGLQSRRLKDAHHDLQNCKAEMDRLASQVKGLVRELASAKAQLGETRECPMRDVDQSPEQIDSDESHGDAVIEGPSSGKDVWRSHHHAATVIEHPDSGQDVSKSGRAATPIDAPDSAQVVDTSEHQSCVRCDIRSQSAKLSGLLLRTMELRVTMSERRQFETESHAVRLLDALQLERCMRLQSEAELKRLKSGVAEAMGEAIENEARWSCVLPDMLDVFLKLGGYIGRSEP